MSTHDLEQRVSTALRELVEEPVGSPSMFDRVAVRGRRRHRRLTGLAAIAVAVVGVTAGGFALGSGTDDSASVVVAAAPCPELDSGQPVNAGRSDLTGRLVPGKPVVATVCRYYGLNQPVPAGTLARSAVVGSAAVAALTAAFNAGELIPKDAVYSCPGAPGGSVLAIFGFRAGAAVTVRISLSGCRFASNGSLTVAPSPQAQQQIADLVGKDPN